MYFDVESLMCVEHNLYLAYKYDKFDSVEMIQITRNEGKTHIHARVCVYEEISECDLYIDEENYVSSQCNCGYCYSSEPCAHVGAVMLKINQLDIDEYPFIYEKEQYSEYVDLDEKRRKKKNVEEQMKFSHSIINHKKSKYLKNIQLMMNDEKYQIYPFFSYSTDCMSIFYGIGGERIYKIKDVDQFIEDIEERKEVAYGKKLKFVHDDSMFDDFSRKQIQFLRDSLHNDPLDLSCYGDYRSLTIESHNIDAFFDLYSETDAFSNVTFITSPDLFPVRVEKDEDYYMLKLDRDIYKYSVWIGKKNVYLITEVDDGYEGDHYVFERYVLDEQGDAAKFLVRVKESSVYVLKEDFPDYVKYILSPIQTYLKLEGFTDLTLNEYTNIKLYGDASDSSTLCFQLFYEDDDFNRVPAFQDDFVTTYEQDLVENYLKTHCDEFDKEKNCAYFHVESEKTYHFIHDDLEKMKNYCDVYVTDALKKIGQTTKYHVSVGISVYSDLLSLDIDSVEIPKAELSDVLLEYRKEQKFYRLQSGELLYLDSPELEELSQIIDKYHLDVKDIIDGEIHLDKNRAFSLENDTQYFKNLQFKRSQPFKHMIERVEKKQESYEMSTYYQKLLRDYQKAGVQWLRTLYNYGFNGILADDMGLGKTLQVIALLDELNLDKTSLIVCPASLIYNWQEETMKFAQNLSVQCIVGKQSQRKKAISKMNKYQLNITSYDYLRKDYETYQNQQLAYVILDESQYIKNPKTRNAIAVKTLKAQHKLALSGTPIENTLAELWSIFDFLMPHYLYNYHYFKTNFETKIIKNHDQEVIHQLQKLVSPFILRRNKKDVLTELPDKIEKTQIIPFDEKESQLYFTHLAQANKELQELMKVDKIDSITILSLLTKLRQICCEPRMIFDDINKISSKMKACIELLCHYKENNQKVLLFSSFTTVFDLMESELKLNGISYVILTGQTSKELRKEYVKMFQDGKVDVFLISLRAGGTGLNLTQAQAVIHYDPWWNISAQNQATDRAYRMGQQNNVMVHKLIMKDSIEEKILKLQDKKKELSDMFVETSDGSISSMSREDILELFK